MNDFVLSFGDISNKGSQKILQIVEDLNKNPKLVLQIGISMSKEMSQQVKWVLPQQIRYIRIWLCAKILNFFFSQNIAELWWAPWSDHGSIFMSVSVPSEPNFSSSASHTHVVSKLLITRSHTLILTFLFALCQSSPYQRKQIYFSPSFSVLLSIWVVDGQKIEIEGFWTFPLFFCAA